MNQQHQQLNELQLNARIENEKKNETKYFRLFTNLLEDKKDIIVKKTVGDTSKIQDYSKEMEVLRKVIAVERDALVGGFVVGTVTFLSVRFLPRMAIRLIGGETKMRSFREREIAAGSKPNAFLKKSGTFLFESMFAFWASWRGYDVSISMKANDLASDVTRLPLCAGRSVVCDEICPDLLQLVNNQIPSEFWRNMEKDDALQNHDYWRHILKFSENCQRRKDFEDKIRKKEGWEDDAKEVIIPSPGVPDHLLSDEQSS